MLKSLSTPISPACTFCSTRLVDAVPVLCRSRFWVVSEWPQISVPPLTGSAFATLGRPMP